MANKKYSEDSCVRSLSKKNSIRISRSNNTKFIEILKDCTDVGLGSLGKIDYLCTVHGYHAIFVKGFANKPVKANASTNYDNSDETDIKANKRERKLNMASMAKNSMRKAKFK